MISIGLKRKHQTEIQSEIGSRHFTIGSIVSDPIAEKRRRIFSEFEQAEKSPFASNHPFPSAQAFRRSSSIELLIKIFPKIKVSVLQLILQSCGGDLVQAIEDVLSKCRNDPAVLVDSSPWRNYVEELHGECRNQRGDSQFKFRRSDPFMGSPRSAFTPLPSQAKTHFYPGPSGSIAFTFDPNRSKENLPTRFLSVYMGPRITSPQSSLNLASNITPPLGKDIENDISLERKNSEDSPNEKEK